MTVVQVKEAGPETWSLPASVLLKDEAGVKPALFRMDHLRARKITVEIVSHSDNAIMVKKGSLPREALLIVRPQDIRENAAVRPVAGVDDEVIIQQILKTGTAAVERKDFRECLRFVSTDYQDRWGYNEKLIEAFLKRAFREFSQPRIEFDGSPSIRVSGNRAMVQTAVRLRAAFQGRSNYLLGDAGSFNALILALEKKKSGWKIVQVDGLKPLGFDEKFMKLIGHEIGLPLSAAEQQERLKACMPCRERMYERFSTRQ